MKNLRLFIVLLLTIMLFASCTFFQPSPSVCDKPEAVESRICAMTATLGLTPEKAGLILRLGSSVALEKNPDEAEKALKYLNEAISLLETDGLTYAVFAEFMKDNPSMFLTIIANELLAEMGNLSLIIGSFDLNLIKIHLTRQRDLVMVSLAQSK